MFQTATGYQILGVFLPCLLRRHALLRVPLQELRNEVIGRLLTFQRQFVSICVVSSKLFVAFDKCYVTFFQVLLSFFREEDRNTSKNIAELHPRRPETVWGTKGIVSRMPSVNILRSQSLQVKRQMKTKGMGNKLKEEGYPNKGAEHNPWHRIEETNERQMNMEGDKRKEPKSERDTTPNTRRTHLARELSTPKANSLG